MACSELHISCVVTYIYLFRNYVDLVLWLSRDVFVGNLWAVLICNQEGATKHLYAYVI